LRSLFFTIESGKRENDSRLTPKLKTFVHKKANLLLRLQKQGEQNICERKNKKRDFFTINVLIVRVERIIVGASSRLKLKIFRIRHF
jgi:hypothetical protein